MDTGFAILVVGAVFGIGLFLWLVLAGYRRLWVVPTAAVAGLSMPFLFHWAASEVSLLQVDGWAPTFTADIAGLIAGVFLLLGSLAGGIRRSHERSLRRREPWRFEPTILDPAKVTKAIEAKARADRVTSEVIHGVLTMELSAFPGTIDSWLNGENEIPSRGLARIAEVLDTSPEQIIVHPVEDVTVRSGEVNSSQSR